MSPGTCKRDAKARESESEGSVPDIGPYRKQFSGYCSASSGAFRASGLVPVGRRSTQRRSAHTSYTPVSGPVAQVRNGQTVNLVVLCGAVIDAEMLIVQLSGLRCRQSGVEPCGR